MGREKVGQGGIVHTAKRLRKQAACAAWLSTGLLLAASCSVERQHSANQGGSAGLAGHGGSNGAPRGGAGGSAGRTMGGGQNGGESGGPFTAGAAGDISTSGGSAGMSAGGVSSGGAIGGGGVPDEGGAAGAGGSGGAPSECQPDQTRSCSEDGARGACAKGTETCTALGTWGPCSIQPKSADTCAQGNDDNCNGAVNEGCPCVQGATRSCADAGLVGKCATGTQTCTDKGTWAACSIQPAAEDTCVQGNNDNCSGPPNEGCSCINGVTTRPCGACNDGTQTCTNGKTNQFGTCTGAVLTPTTYYRDADGDGFGSSATTTVCGSTKPAGYSDQTGDCCDDGGNLTLAAKIHPGQTEFFDTAANICGITWNYDCSANGSIETSPASRGTGCQSGTSAPTCATNVVAFTEANCGGTTVYCGCAVTSISSCTTGCGSPYVVKCH